MSKEKTATKDNDSKPRGRNVTIYVPGEVSEAMQKKEYEDINWSAVATAAFRELIGLPDANLEGRVARLERRLAKISEKLNGSKPTLAKKAG